MKKTSGKQKIIIDTAIEAILKSTQDMVYIKDCDSRYLTASEAFTKVVGLKSIKEIVGKRDEELFQDKELVKKYHLDDKKVLSSQKPLEAYIEIYVDEKGKEGYCNTSKYPLFDETGKTIGLYGISRDITREYLTKQNYEQELNALFELPKEALAAVFLDISNWKIVDRHIIDERVKELEDISSVDEFIQNNLNSVADNEEAEKFYKQISKEYFQTMFASGKRTLSMESQWKLPYGQMCWIHNSFQIMLNPASGNVCVMSILYDIEEEKQAAFELARAAERDALTGIYNREATMKQIEQFLKGEGAGGTHLLFMIDVDNFKQINDTMGHQTGDDTLVYIASAIQKVFRSSDIVGRIGGDEFFALMKDASNTEMAKKRAVELIEALQYECSDGVKKVELSGSVGISRYLGDAKSLQELYAEADAALYKAKRLGKNCFVFADSVTNAWEEKNALNTVSLRTILENMDASIFQTEWNEKGEISITYSSHTLFEEGENNPANKKVQKEEIWNMLLPEDKKQLTEELKEASKEGKALDYSCRIMNEQGKPEWLLSGGLNDATSVRLFRIDSSLLQLCPSL